VCVPVYRAGVNTDGDVQVRTTVVVHVDLDARIGALHPGPLLTDDQRRYLTCGFTTTCTTAARSPSPEPPTAPATP
jgi:hypothetical protein